jgi:hypothetical protein
MWDHKAFFTRVFPSLTPVSQNGQLENVSNPGNANVKQQDPFGEVCHRALQLLFADMEIVEHNMH